MNRGMGWIRDVRRDNIGQLSVPRWVCGAPSAALELRSFVGDPTADIPTRRAVVDQSITSSCVAQAIARAMHVYLLSRGVRAHYASALSVYYMARVYTAGPESVRDQGCYPQDAVDATAAWGVEPESIRPFDPGRVNDALDLDEVQQSAAYKIKDWKRIDSVGGARVEEVKAMLAAGYPCIFGMTVDQAYMTYSGGVYERDPLSASLGGHAQTILGYEDTPSGTIFHVVNSWSTAWGEAGWSRIGADTIGGSAVDDVFALRAAPIFAGDQ